MLVTPAFSLRQVVQMKQLSKICASLAIFLSSSEMVVATEATQWPSANPAKLNPVVEQKVQKILQGMTLEQKVAQMIQPEIGYLTIEQMRKYGFGSYLNGGNTAPYGNKQADVATWLKYADEMYQASVDDSIDGSSIPAIWGTDAMHGHSNVYGATLFPHNIGLGAANDAELIKKIGQATAKEVAATGIEWSFAPTVAVVRDDRWGRTYESYSEDPVIVKAYAGKMVEGIQGELTDDYLTGYHRIATAKHFVGDGGTQNGLDRGDTVVSEAVLRDVHAAGYYSAIEAGVQSVMASFNSWRGQRLHGDKYLLTDVLKGQMGFTGFVVSDWNAHKFVDGCDLEQCATAINAGVDVLMVPEHFEAFYHNTLAQVKQGLIAESRINDAVTRLLRAKVQWGLFDKNKPSTRVNAEILASFNSFEHKQLAREAVRKSLVLLKNNHNTLPLIPNANVLVAGNAANNIAKQAGGWSVSWQGTDNTNADFPNATSIYQGIKNTVESAGGKVELAENGQYSRKPDVAIVVIGEEPYAEWFGDIQRLEYQVDKKQDLALLKKLKQQNIPVVTVFISGRPLWVNKELNQSDAFVAAWLPGSEGQGVADVLFSKTDGSINYDFSGKLSFSWPKLDNQFELNVGDKNYQPLFAYGYGLTYQDKQNLAQLDETTTQVSANVSGDYLALFERNLSAELAWTLTNQATENTNAQVLVTTPYGTSPDKTSLTMQSVNLAYQEDARKFVWRGQNAASFALSYKTAADLTDKISSSSVLTMDIKLDDYAGQAVSVEMLCEQNLCAQQANIGKLLAKLSVGKWYSLDFPLGCGAEQIDLTKIKDIFSMQAQGNLSLVVANIKIADKQNCQ